MKTDTIYAKDIETPASPAIQNNWKKIIYVDTHQIKQCENKAKNALQTISRVCMSIRLLKKHNFVSMKTVSFFHP